MTRKSLVGRVALPSGQALTGFTVELTVDGRKHTAVTDGIGEFRLESPVCTPAAEYPSGELVVRLPDNQIVLREQYPLDGRYLGLTIPRDALPRAAPRRGALLLPQPPDDAPVEPLDVGDHGEILLPLIEQARTVGNQQIAATGNVIAAASGSSLLIWTVDGGEARGPDRLDVGAEVFDVAGDPLRTEIVLLAARAGKRKGRELLAVTGNGQLEQRWAGAGDWDILAVSPEDAAVAMAVAGSTAWAELDGGEVRVHDLGSAVHDLAFAGTAIVVATDSELLMLGPTGEVLERMQWPGQATRLTSADAGRVFGHDRGGGRVTRVLTGPGRRMIADTTIFVGSATAVGWWWERAVLLALLGDRIAWWRPPSVVLQPAPEQADIVFVGPF
ncbi:carboxypeptidase-like regulatory domain-containing protein [Streptomyces sp. PSKA30]|uniref:carboxypeptidase-like regulatory domain-containing protein n=1 Tax=Streptomyces sp. PSKA30 TaxID=2874597 RepID=UPI001CD0479E|nr:carboxypeptidase-like regulatory domain-containing protein [Streptomyces sp. PSKA30]MBZ9644753.1 carboxypeptidase-like regulatory domain-containing protein [Streptomyces sp. PSKA30]